MTSNTVSKRYQGTGILKSDCKQPLRIGIISALNECTGRLFRATTRHNHKSSVFVVFHADVGSCAVHDVHYDNDDVSWICRLYTQCLCSDWSICLERNVIG